jgi:hypothetical protein
MSADKCLLLDVQLFSDPILMARQYISAYQSFFLTLYKNFPSQNFAL